MRINYTDQNDYGFIHTEKGSSAGTEMLVSAKVAIFFPSVDFYEKQIIIQYVLRL